MAVLGFQLIVSLLGATVIQKIMPRMSLARWFIVGLVRYLHPSNVELMEAAKLTKQTSGKKRHKDRAAPDPDEETFSLPKSTPLLLESVEIRALDLVSLPFYIEYRWLVDFGLITVVVYVLSELQGYVLPRLAAHEVNLSLLWCFLLLGFALKSLTSITALYFRQGDEGGERSLCLCMGAVGFLASMVVLLLSNSALDLGVLRAYTSFSESAAEYLKAQDLDFSARKNPVLLYFVFSIFFGFLSGLLTFPCFRFSDLFIQTLKYSAERPLFKLCLYASMVLPLLSCLLWVNPVSRDILVEGKKPLMTLEQLQSLRLWAVLVWVLLRFAVLTLSVQAYLNSAQEKLHKLQSESGKITNVELQRIVIRVFRYLCVVTVQMTAPILLLLSLVFLLKTCGCYSWRTLLDPGYQAATLPEPPASSSLRHEMNLYLAKLSRLVTVDVHRGLWSLLVFWTQGIVFILNALGLLYYSRLQ